MSDDEPTPWEKYLNEESFPVADEDHRLAASRGCQGCQCELLDDNDRGVKAFTVVGDEAYCIKCWVQRSTDA